MLLGVLFSKGIKYMLMRSPRFMFFWQDASGETDPNNSEGGTLKGYGGNGTHTCQLQCTPLQRARVEQQAFVFQSNRMDSSPANGEVGSLVDRQCALGRALLQTQSLENCVVHLQYCTGNHDLLLV